VIDFEDGAVPLKEWATTLNLPLYRAQNLALTAAAYGVTLPAFVAGYVLVYQGKGEDLNKIRETLRYVMRSNKNVTMGFNFPAAMKELPKLIDIDINNSFVWTMLAFKYDISLEDIVDLATAHEFHDVAKLFERGYGLQAVQGFLDHDVDDSLIAQLLEAS